MTLKRPRGAKHLLHNINNNKTKSSTNVYYDLNVPIDYKRKSQYHSTYQNLLRHFAKEEYSVVALSTTLYGAPSAGQKDQLQQFCDYVDNLVQTCNITNQSLKVLKRVNVVVEATSDVGYFTLNKTLTANNASIKDMLYPLFDIIAMVCRNEVTMNAACSTNQSLVDLIVVDTSHSNKPMSFWIKKDHVMEATKRNIAFEMWYSPAIVDAGSRLKYWVQAARSLAQASVGVTRCLPLIVSSGPRNISSNDDLGTLALRSPGDVAHLVRVVLGFHANVAKASVDNTPRQVLELSIHRRMFSLQTEEGCDVALISFTSKNGSVFEILPSNSINRDAPTTGTAEDEVAIKIHKQATTKEEKMKEEIDDDDGFIGL